MENSASYLHKKFKKQLNVLHKDNNNGKQKSGESSRVLESSDKEKTINNVKLLGEKDNNNDVPKNSTNNSSFMQNRTMSSISIANLQSTNNSTCISYVVSSSSDQQQQQQQQQEHLFKSSSVSFDTSRFNPAKSSILENNLYKGKLEEMSSEEKDTNPSTITHQQNTNTSGKYVCTYCNLVCSKPSVLQKHIRAHTNERPYPCISCGFSFKTRSNLYKHCRSRTHANRVMGTCKNPQQQNDIDDLLVNNESKSPCQKQSEDEEKVEKLKPYKPRFHTNKLMLYTKDDDHNQKTNPTDLLSHHINEIINKNNSIVNSNDSLLLVKKQLKNDSSDDGGEQQKLLSDEPLNLTNKNRKRSMSEVVEPVAQKSLIKELLLKNLYSDMQCPHCKMLFQTVTELELHKLRNCRGFIKPGAKYSRSNSVNVASILTHNKNALDDLPASHQLQNAIVFPSLKSPGPCLGKTRLVDCNDRKTFSFDDGMPPSYLPTDSYLQYDGLNREKRMPIKLFGGEVKITQTSGETKSFKIASPNKEQDQFVEFSGKLSENRVVKSTLQSGGTVLTNKPTCCSGNQQQQQQNDCIRVYKNMTFDGRLGEERSSGEQQAHLVDVSNFSCYKYTNIVDFSQKAVKLLTPNIKQPNLTKITLPPIEDKKTTNVVETTIDLTPAKLPENLYNPMNLLVNGKVVRYVPGIPGPVAAECDVLPHQQLSPALLPTSKLEPLEIKTACPSPKLQPTSPTKKKFTRPNSLALKPTTASLKQHHGLTPTMFNQILISPDTPRVAKKYVQQFLHGNYFSYLGLKCSTKPVYCTLNKTQPFYVPHFKKLSMYSEWRQQDTKTDRFYLSAYDSRQRRQRYTMAGKYLADLVVHSSYKFAESESQTKPEKSEDQKSATTILGGYECNDDYTYIRGRGRGRYVCDQCGIRCKKPSMLKKHIRTHSNDRPYTCNHCNFSFKTKGNLTKHMKSKVHTKNYIAGSSSGSSTQMSGTQSSESDTDDSGMDSSDESTRREEHEAAYGLLSLSQKTTAISHTDTINKEPLLMDNDEIVHVTKANYAKNKILNEKTLNLNTTVKSVVLQSSETTAITTTTTTTTTTEVVMQFLGTTTVNRPLTYPYTDLKQNISIENNNDANINYDNKMSERKNIKEFHVVQKYTPTTVLKTDRVPLPIVKVNDVLINEQTQLDLRKRKSVLIEDSYKTKIQKNDNEEVMDLSIEKNHFNIEQVKQINNQVYSAIQKKYESNHLNCYNDDEKNELDDYQNNKNLMKNGNLLILSQENEENSKKSFKEYDNSAMETLADIATKQVKLEKNTLAKSVASEYLKLATKNEYSDNEHTFPTQNKDVNELIVKSEGSKSCSICLKNFSKPSQLRLHMNIHYLERPFRCESCSVSFRTKGHLQKHERSAGHHNKLSSSPALSSSEPRPFKCIDCNIAFRIHGHLAKHLRSKMHIMKLECLAKIPFGLYAELERSNSLLTEINTADGDQCLESLKTLAKKVFVNDPNKLVTITENLVVDS